MGIDGEFPPAEVEELLRDAGRALAAAGRGSVELRVVEIAFHSPGAPSTVVRSSIDGKDSARLPPTVAVKRINRPGEEWLLDVVGLEFLSGLDATRDLAPELLAVDRHKRLVVLEDLGSSRDTMLAWILAKADEERAEQALLERERAVGRMHGATRAEEGRYSALLAGWRPAGSSRHRVNRLPRWLAELPDRALDLGIAVGDAAHAELRAAASELAEPGPFRCYTHGDPTLSNAFLTSRGLRFIDFETGAFRHALVDGAFARIRYLNSVFARRIPVGLQRRLTEEYRRQLAQWLPEADDDRLFARGLLAACAAWLAVLCSLLPSVADHDRMWGRTTWRQRIVTGLADFAATAAELGALAALGDVATAMERELRRRWPEEDCTMVEILRRGAGGT